MLWIDTEIKFDYNSYIRNARIVQMHVLLFPR